MRLIRFEHGTAEAAYGVLEGQVVLAVEGNPFGQWSPGNQVAPLDEVRLVAPCVPSKIVAVGRNYVAHAQEHKAAVPEQPLIFLKPPSAVIGPGESIVYPHQSEWLEHEGELVIVMGQRGRSIPIDRVQQCILGYTCGNDVTARDLQRADNQWTRGKGFDTFCPLGPWIETTLDPSQLLVECRVNGETRQTGSTSEMVFGVDYLVSYISAVMTLEPGDVILTGTPAGVSPLQAGDTVEVEVQGIGVLENPVIRGSDVGS